MTTAGSTPAKVARPALYTFPFIAILVVALLGFGQTFLLQPVLPLRILDLGGNAAFVGIAFAAYSIPSIVLRPIIGQFADRWGLQRVLLAGAGGITLVAPLYLVPNLAVLILARFVDGMVWAAFSTGCAAMLARIAPVGRRVEASGMYDLMPAVASFVMPATGLVLLAWSGFGGPFVLAAALGAGATIAALTILRRAGGDPRTQGSQLSAPSRRYLEPTARIPMVVVLLLTSASPLFLVYPPLLAAERGIPLDDLALYYLAFGMVLVLGRLFTRRLEAVRASRVLGVGAGIGAAGLLVAAGADSLPMLSLGAVIFAFAFGFAPPAAQAVVMERTPRERLGSAMATYTIGFQMGSGLGAAVWGVLLGPLGFASAFMVAAFIQLALVGVVAVARAALDPPAAVA